MSDILITNMRWPKEGEIIHLTIGSDGAVCEYSENDPGRAYMGNHVAIEVPAHGRLVDADKIDTQVDLEFFDEEGRKIKSIVSWNGVKNAPTVIEASNSPKMISAAMRGKSKGIL